MPSIGVGPYALVHAPQSPSHPLSRVPEQRHSFGRPGRSLAIVAALPRVLSNSKVDQDTGEDSNNRRLGGKVASYCGIDGHRHSAITGNLDHNQEIRREYRAPVLPLILVKGTENSCNVADTRGKKNGLQYSVLEHHTSPKSVIKSKVSKPTDSGGQSMPVSVFSPTATQPPSFPLIQAAINVNPTRAPLQVRAPSLNRLQQPILVSTNKAESGLPPNPLQFKEIELGPTTTSTSVRGLCNRSISQTSLRPRMMETKENKRLIQERSTNIARLSKVIQSSHRDHGRRSLCGYYRVNMSKPPCLHLATHICNLMVPKSPSSPNPDELTLGSALRPMRKPQASIRCDNDLLLPDDSNYKKIVSFVEDLRQSLEPNGKEATASACEALESLRLGSARAQLYLNKKLNVQSSKSRCKENYSRFSTPSPKPASDANPVTTKTTAFGSTASSSVSSAATMAKGVLGNLKAMADQDQKQKQKQEQEGVSDQKAALDTQQHHDPIVLSTRQYPTQTDNDTDPAPGRLHLEVDYNNGQHVASFENATIKSTCIVPGTQSQPRLHNEELNESLTTTPTIGRPPKLKYRPRQPQEPCSTPRPQCLRAGRRMLPSTKVWNPGRSRLRLSRNANESKTKNDSMNAEAASGVIAEVEEGSDIEVGKSSQELEFRESNTVRLQSRIHEYIQTACQKLEDPSHNAAGTVDELAACSLSEFNYSRLKEQFHIQHGEQLNLVPTMINSQPKRLPFGLSSHRYLIHCE